jgi:hypothetical protein
LFNNSFTSIASLSVTAFSGSKSPTKSYSYFLGSVPP